MHVINRVACICTVKMESSAIESSMSSGDGCESSRSSTTSCHTTGAGGESEIRPSLLETL